VSSIDELLKQQVTLTLYAEIGRPDMPTESAAKFDVFVGKFMLSRRPPHLTTGRVQKDRLADPGPNEDGKPSNPVRGQIQEGPR